MRVYLDVCCLQRPLDDATNPRIANEADATRTILAAVESGQIEILTSEPLEFETMNNPNPPSREHAEGVLGLAGERIAASQEVVELAIGYNAMGMKNMDALHVACSVLGDADYFLTCDDQLIRIARRANTRSVVVCSPVEFPWEML